MKKRVVWPVCVVDIYASIACVALFLFFSSFCVCCVGRKICIAGYELFGNGFISGRRTTMGSYVGVVDYQLFIVNSHDFFWLHF